MVRAPQRGGPTHNVLIARVVARVAQACADAHSPPPSHAEQMRSWTVAETARFLEGQDLAGPAEQTQRSGVNGVVLLVLSRQQLCTDVLLTPWAARKVVAARDAFLKC